MALTRTSCDSTAHANALTDLFSDASPRDVPSDSCRRRCCQAGGHLSARHVRSNAARPCANRLLHRQGAHRQPESQPRVRQSAGAIGCRTAARHDRYYGSLPPSLSRKACRYASLLYMLPGTQPLGIKVPPQLQTALARAPRQGLLPDDSSPAPAHAA
jgi:hypothetical protein